MQKINAVLSDEQWQKLEPLLIGRPGDSGMSGRDNRLFIEAVLWVALKVGPWTSLPPEFGRWRTSYMRFRRWTKADLWRRICDSLAEDRQLLAIISAIAELGDNHTRQNTERSIRRNSVKIYDRALASSRRLIAPKIDAEDYSSSWVWLVSNDDRKKRN